MAYVSTVVSGAASLGVLIGLISGIFFLVLTALRWVTRVRESLYEEELRRQKRFLITNPYLAGTGSSDFVESRKTENGFSVSSNRLEKIEENDQSNATSTAQWTEPEVDENPSEKQDPNTDTIKVREIIEKMVETMIEGPLDGTTVGQLSTHTAWKNALEVDSTDTAQTNLKRLIKRIVTEAMALPNIKDILRAPRRSRAALDEDFKNKSYEDILATAILNKVIENFQNKNYSEAIDGNPKPRLRKKKIRRNDDKSDDDWSDTSRSDQLSLTIEEYIEEVTTALEASDDDRSELSDYETVGNRRIPFPESGRTVVDDSSECSSTPAGSISSTSKRAPYKAIPSRLSGKLSDHVLEQIVTGVKTNPTRRCRVCSSKGKRSETRYVCKTCCVALHTAGTDDENSDLEEANAATELITSSNSWEENWLFQKKRLRSTPNAHHPVPVPMLVPNPSEDFRALVGGVDADDLSDMSDCDLEELITAEEKPLLADADMIDAGHEKEKEVGCVLEEDHSKEEEVRKENPLGDVKEEVADVEAQKENCEIEECNSREEVEETERSLGGEMLPDVLLQKDRESSIVDFSHQYESLGSNSPSERTTESEESTIRCRLAEREKEKWMNPITLTENPYSLENIEKRDLRKKNEYFRIGTYTGESIDFPEDLSSDELSKNETDKSRFSRDYYINASKHPAGMPSPKRLSDNSWQKFPDGNESPEEEKIIEMQPVQKPEPKRRVVNESEFRLPSVKELAKHFTKDDSKEERKPTTPPKQEREVEVDYSTTPVSEIILNLQQAAETPVRSNIRDKDITYSNATQMEICRKVDSKIIVEKPDPVRFNGKQVHSLTARSISKEFREGLKNNSYQRNYQRVDRSSSGGESDQGEVVSSRMSTSPTPSVDLKNMKKFWETIITANANATKQK